MYNWHITPLRGDIMGKTLEVAVVGCGSRGRAYAKFALEEPGKMMITAVAEPIEYRRTMTGDMFSVPEENRFASCEEFIASGIRVDAVINATMDKDHYSTAVMILNAGFDMLIEKPVCLTKDELTELYKLSMDKERKVMVCHVLRYAPFYLEIKKRILAGEIGKVTSMVTEENVSFHHYSTAFCRGKWGNSDVCGSHMMMSKCCHDLDIITWMKNDSRPEYVSSMGGLFNFIKKNFPEGAGEKCTVDCNISNTCEFDAKKMYFNCETWGYYVRECLDDYDDRDSNERLLKSIGKDNPYGKCVWKCDNNVVDHQTVLIEFEDGCTVSHNLLGATAKPERTIHIVGTKGEIYGEMESKTFYIRKPDMTKAPYYIEETIVIDVETDGHGGGDSRLAADFASYISGGETTISTTALGDSIYGHLIGFNAHEAMTKRKVVKIERL